MTTYSFSSGARIDLNKAELTSATNDVYSLGHKESELLKLLLARSPEVVSKNEITESIWQRPSISESAISVAIAKLRKQLNNAAIDEVEIITAKGVGYRATYRDIAKNDLQLPEPLTATTEITQDSEKISTSSQPKTTNAPSLDTSLVVADKQADNDKKHLWSVALTIISLSFWLTIYWLYTFTECQRFTVPMSGHTTNVEICWSESSPQLVSGLAGEVSSKETAIILVDKHNKVKHYNQQGEVQPNAK